MENRKMEFMARIKPILDKAQTKKDFEEFQELFDEIKVDLDGASLKKIGEMFNKKLAELGRQQIVLSDITVGKGALEALTSQFVSAIKTAFVDGAQAGIEDAAKHIADKKLKLEQLVNQKGEFEAKQEKLKKNVSQKTKIESIKDFRPNETTAKDMGDTLEAVKTKMREAIDKFNELVDKVPHEQLSTESDKDYAKRVMAARTDVINARQYLDELLRMNISVSGHRGALSVEAPDLWSEWKEVMDEDGGSRWRIEDAWAIVEDIYDRSVSALEQYKKRIDVITDEINSLSAELGVSATQDEEPKKRGRPKKVQGQTDNTTVSSGETEPEGSVAVSGDVSTQDDAENARKVAEEAEKERLAKEAAAKAAEQKRIEEEAAAEAARKAAELAEQEKLAREAAAEAAAREAAAKASMTGSTGDGTGIGGGADQEELKALQEKLKANQSELDIKTKQLAESEEALAKANADKDSADKRANDALAEADRLRADKDKYVDTSVRDEALKDFLAKTVFNVKVQSDENGAAQSEPWALESTLQAVKGVLDGIQTNTANSSKDSASLDSISKTVGLINSKLVKGKTSSPQPKEPQSGFDKKIRQDAYKDLERRYTELGDLEARFKTSGNVDVKDRAEQLLRAVEAEKTLLNLTEQEIGLLELRRKTAYDAYASTNMSPEQQKNGELENKLRTLYKQLGEAEANLAYAEHGEANKNIRENDINNINKKIDSTKEFIKVTDELNEKLEALRTSRREEVSNKIVEAGTEELYKKYMQLGKAQAQAEVNPEDAVKQSAVKNLQTTIDLEKQRLGLNQEQYKLQVDLFEAKQRDAYISELQNQADKQQNANLKQQIKTRRDEARVTKAKSVWTKGDDILRSLWKVDDKDIDALQLKEVKDLRAALQDLDRIRQKVDAGKGNIGDKDASKLRAYTAEVEKHSAKVQELIKNYEFFNKPNAIDTKSTLIAGGNIQQQLTNAAKLFSGGKASVKEYNEELQRLTVEWKTGHRQLTTYTFGLDGVSKNIKALKGATKTLPSLLDSIKKKTRDVFTYLMGTISVYDFIRIFKQGIKYVAELDGALTDLKKVTDETAKSYDRFLDSAAKTAHKVGATVTEIVNSTADWARLGYSMEEALDLAESTSVLLNVSEFQSIDEATSALTSTMQAFGYAAKDSMYIVDVMNEIGNNYAISSDGIATALQDSASALMSANNSYEEAVAMIAAGNRVVQDPSALGGGLRTIALRLRGTSVEGEENDGLITSKSKLQSKVKSLSGVDILTQTGDYRSTYEILLDISKVWEDMSDIDQAALLEIIAGKNRSNIAASLLSNTKDLEAAFESAQNAENSAIIENEKYLDSIQGRIDQFNNAVQVMWNNLLNSDVIKFLINVGTKIIQIIDKLGTIGTVLAGLSVYGMIKGKTGPVGLLMNLVELMASGSANIRGFGKYIKSLVQSTTPLKKVFADLVAAQVEMQASTAAAQFNEAKLTQAQLVRKASTLGLSQSITTLNAAQMSQALQTAGVSREQRLATIQSLGLDTTTKALTATQISNALAAAGVKDANIQAILSAIGLSTANKGLAASFTTLWTAIWPVLAVMAAVAAVYGVVKLFDAVHKTSKELGEELSDLKSEFSDIKSDIDSLNSELKTAQKRMAELLAMPSLSFIEQEELANLKQTTAELERQLEVKEMLADSKEAEIINTSEEYVDSVWNSSGVDKSYYIDDYGVIHEDVWSKSGVNTKDALDSAMQKYVDVKASRDNINDLLNDFDTLTSDGVTLDEYKQILTAAYGENFVQQYKSYIDSFDTSNLNTDGWMETLITIRDNRDKLMADIASGINMVFADENFEDLEYGMSDDIDAFLDEIYTYQLKFRQVQGQYVKSDAISSMFDTTSTDKMRELGKELQNIADNDSISDVEKEAQIRTKISEAINSNSDAYNHLNLVMETLGVTAEDISDYFILESGIFDSSTIEGVTAQYANALSVMQELKNMSSDGSFTLGENSFNFNDFFKVNDNGEFEANALKFSEILRGIDEDCRDTFMSLSESVRNGELTWEQAMRSFEHAGNLAGLKVIEEQIISLNNVEFKNISDEISGVIDTFGELSSALDDVASSMDLLNTAQTQMNKSGRISVKTALEIMQSTDQWNDILEIEDGNIRLVGDATKILVEDKISLIKANLQNALSTVTEQLAMIDSQNASEDLATTMEESTNQAVRKLAGSMAYLTKMMEAYTKIANGEDVDTEWYIGEAQKVQAAAERDLNWKLNSATKTGKGDLEKRKAEIEAELAMLNGIDTGSEFKNYYDYDETPGDKYDDSDALDSFQKEMDYWENLIGVNQTKSELIQNRIDLLEKQGKIVGEDYYLKQKELEEERLDLLTKQQNAAEALLYSFDDGSDEWWEVANTINDLEVEIDSVTASIQDLKDAIDQIHWDIFDEVHERFGDLTSQLETARELLSADEDSFFDDEGEWTETGVAVLGTHIQELEIYQNALDDVNKELANLNIDDFDSEQEYYDKRQELIEQQHEYATAVSDTKQSVVDMYESQIDAVEEYIDELVDNYNDYIDVVKEALDAERDLYKFRKDIQKQTKDIALLERRIASLSGANDAASIAERRKLEAELAEAKEGLNDTYYDHAKDAQSQALDDESKAYEKAMNKFIEGLRDTLDAALLDMDGFMGLVANAVMTNAPAIKEQYEGLGLSLDDAIINPWTEAANKIKEFGGVDGLGVMNSWITEGGAIYDFNTGATNLLTSPWSAGLVAVQSFASNLHKELVGEDGNGGIVGDVRSNVADITSMLDDLAKRLKETPTMPGGNPYPTPDPDPTPGPDPTPDPVKPIRKNYLMSDHKVVMSPKYVDDDGGLYYKLEGYSDRFVPQTSVSNRSGILYAVEGSYYYTAQEKNIKRQALTANGKYTINGIENTLYANGTLGTKHDGFAITDESWIGEEITLAAGKNGQLQYLKKGSSVLPADISANLVEWGKINPNMLNIANPASSINMISNAINKPEIKLDVENFLRCDNVSQDSMPELKKFVNEQMNSLIKQLNYSLKKSGA